MRYLFDTYIFTELLNDLEADGNQCGMVPGVSADQFLLFHESYWTVFNQNVKQASFNSLTTEAMNQGHVVFIRISRGSLTKLATIATMITLICNSQDLI